MALKLSLLIIINDTKKYWKSNKTLGFFCGIILNFTSFVYFCKIGFEITDLVLNFVLNCNLRAPSASRIRAKMLYATSKDGIRRALDGIHYELQATEPSEMGFDIIQDRAK